MKREDLYRNRGTRPPNISFSRTNRNHIKTNINAVKYLPLCHWLQLCLCIFLLLFLISSHHFIKQDKLQEFHSSINHQITYSTDLPQREWNGSLKEILFQEK